MDGSAKETKRLRRNVEWALRRALDPAAVLPMLHRLSRLAADGTDESVYAQRRLAELLADTHPWRAALHAKRVLAVQPTDDGAWSILALCHALLGHYRCATAAYRRALAHAPHNAAYAHNLGHLVDVALGRPREAVEWLRVAYDGTFQRADVAISLAHALARAGELEEAKRVSDRALVGEDVANAREHAELREWLDQGAPDARALLPRRPPAPSLPSAWVPGSGRRRRPSARGVTRSPAGRHRDAGSLEDALARGLANLPLDRLQRARALALARNPWVTSALDAGLATVPTIAAALAYAILHVDHVPLTQADVAACFRVSVPALRGVFKALRAHLDLTRGDAPYATVRPR